LKELDKAAILQVVVVNVERELAEGT